MASEFESSLLCPRHRLVVLGAGRGVKSDMPSAMMPLDKNTRVLDWILASFSAVPNPEIAFVGGYRLDLVEKIYPAIRFYYNADWADSGPVKSLSYVPLASMEATYVTYSDVVLRQDAIRRLHQSTADITLAVDSRWMFRFEARSRIDISTAEKLRIEDGAVHDIGRHLTVDAAHAEFAGILRISGRLSRDVQRVIRENDFDRRAGIPDVVRFLIGRGHRIEVIDVEGDWAELNAPQDLARFVLGTKAESLERLRPVLKHGHIGAQVSFTHKEHTADKDMVIERIQEVFGGAHVIVRSSALSEDGWVQSGAGAYESIPDVPADQPARTADAVQRVFASYGDPSPGDQVLVQEMVRKVRMSGVVMTRTPTHGAPYYVINFDDSSQRTDTVTSGVNGPTRTLFLFHGMSLIGGVPPDMAAVVAAIEEVVSVVGHDSLDIEFAVDEQGRVHVLQVRPIAISHLSLAVDDDLVEDGVRSGREFFIRAQIPPPFVLGRRTRFSVMTDWNPAEMIGIKPNRLAMSLYRTLITDEVWAAQRAQYGYRDVRPANLIADILGHPYVDIRVDFNSFIPASLPEPLAEKLVDYYMDVLDAAPHLHDKVEFDILLTCTSFDLEERTSALVDAGFSRSEIAALRDGLTAVTRNGIARCSADLDAMRTADERVQRIIAADVSPLDRIYALKSDLQRFGVLVFAHLARHGFVAMTILNSLRAKGLITAAERDEFMASLQTIPARMQSDAAKVHDGTIDYTTFVTTYGHLRPGSYDITSPCYAEKADDYLAPMVEAGSSDLKPTKPWVPARIPAIEEALRALGLEGSFVNLESFLRDAIEGREFGKFFFMRGVNAILESIAEFGSHHDLTREELSAISLNDYLSLRGVNSNDVATILQARSREGMRRFRITQSLVLPSQIWQESDFYCIEQPKTQPNFVTQKKLVAEVVSLTHQQEHGELAGRIVVIPNADPGFDWLFSKRIGGLITMYGGVNSHMSIRVAEFGLPAAIGVGEILFEQISQAEIVELDCASKLVRVVR